MDVKELGQNVDKVLDAVKAIQSKAGELETKINAIDKAAIDKAIKDATDGMAAVQAMKQESAAKVAEMETTIKLMEKKLARTGGAGTSGDVNEMSEQDKQYRKQFSRYARRGQAVDVNLLDDVCRSIAEKVYIEGDDGNMPMIVKDLVAGSNPGGGYWIRPQRANFMATRIFETSPLRRLANVTSVAGDSLEVIIDDNEATSGGWVGEVASRTKSATPDIGKITIPVQEQFAMPIATQKMLDDAGFDVESWLSAKIVDKMSRIENTAFVSGVGGLAPIGFLSYPAAAAADTYQRGAIGQFTSTGTSGLLDKADDLKSVQWLLKEPYQNGASWGMKRATFGALISLKDSYGQYVFQSRFINEMDQMVLLGKEVNFMDDMQAVTNSALSVVYANFKLAYTIVDRFGFRVIRDDVTNKPYIQFYTTKRVGGAVTNYDAIKILKVKP